VTSATVTSNAVRAFMNDFSSKMKLPNYSAFD
jgi:hypothetical protein